ncbi:MAG: hypothetical protein GX034_03710 [Clostridiaceae bacterium]|jgi:predicted small lipoprotein YifL|nr:hypothetical protein [Clostridiaceae bacterium]
MKKAIALLLVFATLFSFAACKNTDKPGNEQTNPSSQETLPAETEPETEPNTQPTDLDLLAMIDEIYKVQPLDFEVFNSEIDLSDTDSLTYYTGLTDASGVKSAAVSEGAMSTMPYSLVLFQLEADADAEEVGAEIIKGVDPRKWICVEAEDVKLVANGDLIMLIMTPADATQTSADFIAAFTEVRGEPAFELTK